MLPLTSIFPIIYLTDERSIMKSNRISSTEYPPMSFISSGLFVEGCPWLKSNFKWASEGPCSLWCISPFYILFCCLSSCFWRFPSSFFIVERVSVPTNILCRTIMFLSTSFLTSIKEHISESEPFCLYFSIKLLLWAPEAFEAFANFIQN